MCLRFNPFIPKYVTGRTVKLQFCVNVLSIPIAFHSILCLNVEKCTYKYY